MSQPAEEPPRKRQRVTQACHRCRRKKYKCDSERPTCSTCRSSHSECTYGTVAKRRGLQSGYVRAVEVLWGLVFKRIEGSQLAVNDLLVNLSNIISPSPNDASNNDIGSDRADDLLECWRNSGVPSAIESMLDGAFTTNQIGMSQDLENQINLSLTSVRNWSLPQSDLLQGTPPQVLSPPPIAQTLQPTAAGVISDTAYPPENTSSIQQTALLPLPSDWHSLTQIYFTVEHSWFPILERHALFRIAYHYQDESDAQNTLDDRQRGDYAVLWAVLALGEIHSSGTSSPRAAHFKSQSRYFLDRDPVQNDYNTYAQAFLLWSMIHMGCNKLVLARSMLAQALVFCTAAVRESSERRCGLTLSGCFVMDALMALATDTRPLMSVDDLHASVPCDESGSDEWEPYVDKFGIQGFPVSSSSGTPAVPSRISSTFNHLLQLFRILNTAMRKQTSALDLTADIEIWRFNLPRHLNMTEPSTRQISKNVLPPQIHLRAFYSAVLYIAESKEKIGQARPHSHNSQQDPLYDLTASLIQIGRQFGAQAIPASVSVLISSFSSRSTSLSFNQDTTTPDTRNVMRKYKALWGWDHEPYHQYHQEEGSADTAMVNQIQVNDQLPPSLTSQDPLHAAMHCEIPRGLSATFNLENDLSETDGQASVTNMVTSGQSDAAGLDQNLMTFDDATASGPDSMFADTPTQLLDYLALLQQNER